MSLAAEFEAIAALPVGRGLLLMLAVAVLALVALGVLVGELRRQINRG
jgi:hypothetical protein